MKMIGEDLLEYLRSMRARGSTSSDCTRSSGISISQVVRPKILFLPRTDPLPEDSSMGIEAVHRKPRIFRSSDWPGLSGPPQHRVWPLTVSRTIRGLISLASPNARASISPMFADLSPRPRSMTSPD